MSNRLSSLLVEDGRVPSQRMTDALERQALNGGCLDTSLLEIKAIDEDVLIQYLKRSAQLPAFPRGLHQTEPPLPAVLEVFTQTIAETYRAVPAKLLPGGILQVLVTVEVDIAELEALAQLVKQRIEPWIVLEHRFQEAFRTVYGGDLATRFARLQKRSNQAHEAKGFPAPIPVDPIPRFGSLDALRLNPQPKPAQPEKPVVSEPVAVQPVVPEPVVAQPVVSEPVVSEPVVSEPVVAQPVVSEPVVSEPVVSEPVVSEPVVFEPVVSEPVVSEPVVSEPVVSEPVVSEPVVAQPVVSEPVVSEPIVSEPVVSEPVVAQPVVSEPVVSEPVVSEPVVSGPVVVQQVVSASVVSEPVVVQPGVSAPVVSEPTGDARTRDTIRVPALADVPEGGEPSMNMDDWLSADAWLSAAESRKTPINEAAAKAAADKAAADTAAADTAAAQAKAAADKAAAQAKAAADKAAADKAAAQAKAAADKAAADKAAADKAAADKAAADKAAAQAKAAATVVPASVGASGRKKGRRGKEVVLSAQAPTLASPHGAKVQPAAQPASQNPQPQAPAKTEQKNAQQHPADAISAPKTAPQQPADAVRRSQTAPQQPADAVRSSQTAAIPEAVPEPVLTGRLGEALSETTSAAHAIAFEPPPPSALSPIPFAGPPHRIALSLTDDGSQPLSLEACAERFETAKDRDDLIRTLLRGLRSRVSFALLLTKHGDVLRGRLSLAWDFGEPELLEKAVLSLEPKTPFARAMTQEALSAVSFSTADSGATVLSSLERPLGVPAYLWPVVVRGKPVAAIYADDDGHSLDAATQSELSALVAGAAAAWSRLQQPEPSAAPETADSSVKTEKMFPPPATQAAPSNVPVSVSEQATTPMRSKRQNGDETQKLVPAPQPASKTERMFATTTPETDVQGLVQLAKTGDAAATTKLLLLSEAGAQAVVAALPEDAPPDHALMRVLLRFGEHAVKPMLAKIGQPDTPGDMRATLASLFADMPTDTALPAFKELLFDRNDTVRTKAKHALRSFPPSAPLRTLRKTLLDTFQQSDSRLRMCAIEALVALRETTIIPDLIEILSDEFSSLAEPAQRGLFELCKQDFGTSSRRWQIFWEKHGHEPRLSWLLAGLYHANEIVRASAQEELLLLSGDVAGYRFDQPKRERDKAAARWSAWWHRRGY